MQLRVRGNVAQVLAFSVIGAISLSLFLSLSLSLSASVRVCACVYVSNCVSFLFSACLSVFLIVCLYVCMYACLSMCLSSISVCLPVCLSKCASVYILSDFGAWLAGTRGSRARRGDGGCVSRAGTSLTLSCGFSEPWHLHAQYLYPLQVLKPLSRHVYWIWCRISWQKKSELIERSRAMGFGMSPKSFWVLLSIIAFVYNLCLCAHAHSLRA